MIDPDPNLVLVTGASGFVGGALVRALASAGWGVRAAARDVSQVPRAPGIEAVLLPDLGARVDWGPFLAGASHVVHLAGIAHARTQLSEAVYQCVNAEASAELAHAAGIAGVRRLVLMSSIRAQSGPAATHPLTEATPPAPTDAYGRSKLAAEAAVMAELGQAVSILRPVLVMGPGVKGNLAALRRLASSPMPLPFGGLHNRRSLIGLRNLASAVAFGLSADIAGGRLFLVADPEPLRLRDLIAAMRAALGRRPGLVAIPPGLLKIALAASGRQALAQSLLGDLIADCSALKKAGWQPPCSSEAEISRMMTQDA